MAAETIKPVWIPDDEYVAALDKMHMEKFADVRKVAMREIDRQLWHLLVDDEHIESCP
jgi:hypothetical protein